MYIKGIFSIIEMFECWIEMKWKKMNEKHNISLSIWFNLCLAVY